VEQAESVTFSWKADAPFFFPHFVSVLSERSLQDDSLKEKVPSPLEGRIMAFWTRRGSRRPILSPPLREGFLLDAADIEPPGPDVFSPPVQVTRSFPSRLVPTGIYFPLPINDSLRGRAAADFFSPFFFLIEFLAGQGVSSLLGRLAFPLSIAQCWTASPPLRAVN